MLPKISIINCVIYADVWYMPMSRGSCVLGLWVLNNYEANEHFFFQTGESKAVPVDVKNLCKYVTAKEMNL